MRFIPVLIIEKVLIILNTVCVLMRQRQRFDQCFDQAVGIVDALFGQEAVADDVAQF